MSNSINKSKQFISNSVVHGDVQFVDDEFDAKKYCEQLITKYSSLKDIANYVSLYAAQSSVENIETVAVENMSLSPSEAIELIAGRLGTETNADDEDKSAGVAEVGTVSKLAQKIQYLLVLGGPGTGKSTSVKNFVLRQSHRYLADEENEFDGTKRIPVVIEAKEYNPEKSRRFEELVARQLKVSLGKAIDMLFEGEVHCIVDGINEISSVYYSEAVEELRSLMMSNQKCGFFITSRNYGYNYNLKAARVFQIKPLSDDDIEYYLNKRYPKQAKKLWRKLQEPQNEHIYDLCSNPLMLSLVAAAASSGGTIPANKGQLYYFCVKGVIIQEFRAIRKNYEGELHDFEAFAYQFFSRIAMGMKERGSLSAAKSSVAKIPLPESYSLEQLLRWQLLNVSEDEVSIIHESFIDYFASVHLVNNIKHGTFREFYEIHILPTIDNPMWIELLIMCGESIKNFQVPSEAVFKFVDVLSVDLMEGEQNRIVLDELLQLPQVEEVPGKGIPRIRLSSSFWARNPIPITEQLFVVCKIVYNIRKINPEAYLYVRGLISRCLRYVVATQDFSQALTLCKSVFALGDRKLVEDLFLRHGLHGLFLENRDFQAADLEAIIGEISDSSTYERFVAFDGIIEPLMLTNTGRMRLWEIFNSARRNCPINIQKKVFLQQEKDKKEADRQKAEKEEADGPEAKEEGVGKKNIDGKDFDKDLLKLIGLTDSQFYIDTCLRLKMHTELLEHISDYLTREEVRNFLFSRSGQQFIDDHSRYDIYKEILTRSEDRRTIKFIEEQLFSNDTNKSNALQLLYDFDYRRLSPSLRKSVEETARSNGSVGEHIAYFSANSDDVFIGTMGIYPLSRETVLELISKKTFVVDDHNCEIIAFRKLVLPTMVVFEFPMDDSELEERLADDSGYLLSLTVKTNVPKELAAQMIQGKEIVTSDGTQSFVKTYAGGKKNKKKNLKSSIHPGLYYEIPELRGLLEEGLRGDTSSMVISKFLKSVNLKHAFHASLENLNYWVVVQRYNYMTYLWSFSMFKMIFINIFDDTIKTNDVVIREDNLNFYKVYGEDYPVEQIGEITSQIIGYDYGRREGHIRMTQRDREKYGIEKDYYFHRSDCQEHPKIGDVVKFYASINISRTYDGFPKAYNIRKIDQASECEVVWIKDMEEGVYGLVEDTATHIQFKFSARYVQLQGFERRLFDRLRPGYRCRYFRFSQRSNTVRLLPR